MKDKIKMIGLVMVLGQYGVIITLIATTIN